MRTFVIWCTLASACSSSEAPNLATATSAVIAPYLQPPGTVGKFSKEPSGAFVTPNRLVVGFNDNVATNGWAVSTDAGATFSQVCSFDGTALVGSCSAVPIPAGSGCNPACPAAMPFCDHGTCKPYMWRGDPTVVSDRAGNIVYVSLGDSDGGADANVVAASLSIDGGATFASTAYVNDAGCNNGAQDQPNATFDYTTSPPTLWIVWRHEGIGLNGGCIRRGRITGSAIQWLDDPQEIEGMGGSDNAFAYQGGLWVAAGDGRVTVMYNAFTTFMPTGSTPCPDSGGLNGMIWGSVVSFDNARNWVDNSRIFHTRSWQWCVIGSPGPGLPGSMLAGLRAFSLARGPGSVDYAVLQDSRNSIRFFMSPAVGIKGWENETNALNTWYELCPGTPTSSVPGGPTSNWRNADLGPCPFAAITLGGTGLDVAFPTLAVDPRGHVLVSYYEEQFPAGTGILRVMTRGLFNPQDPTQAIQGPVPASAPFSGIPGRGLGDYMWLAVRPPREGPEPPGCGPVRLPNLQEDFFPIWTQPLAFKPTPNVETLGATLTQ